MIKLLRNYISLLINTKSILRGSKITSIKARKNTGLIKQNEMLILDEHELALTS